MKRILEDFKILEEFEKIKQKYSYLQKPISLLTKENEKLISKKIEVENNFTKELNTLEQMVVSEKYSFKDIHTFYGEWLLPKILETAKKYSQLVYDEILSKPYITKIVNEITCYHIVESYLDNRIIEKEKIKQQSFFNFSTKQKEEYASYIDSITIEHANLLYQLSRIYKLYDENIIKWDYQTLKNKFEKLLKIELFEEVYPKLLFYNIEKMHQKLSKEANIILFSHRYGGWNKVEYKISEDLKIEIRSNFGYGQSSHFYILVVYKNISISTFSDFVDYRYAGYSETIRYTRSFVRKFLIEKGRYKYIKEDIKDEYWEDLLRFVVDLSSLYITDENKFIEKYIIEECEKMVEGLENIYKGEIKYIDPFSDDYFSESVDNKIRFDKEGYELISYQSEKIIGALHFIERLMEYKHFFSSEKYINRLVEIADKFFPNIQITLQKEQQEYKDALQEFQKHSNLIKEKREKLGQEANYNQEYQKLIEKQRYFSEKYGMHLKHIDELKEYIKIYKKIRESQK